MDYGHNSHLTQGIRELPPANGWRVFEPDGTATFRCDTHRVEIAGPSSDVSASARAHLAPARDRAIREPRRNR